MQFNYENFKQALKKVEEKRWEELKADIKSVEDFIENLLTKIFESSASKATSTYAGIDL